MTTPAIGTRWLDTRAVGPSTAVRNATIDDGVWRRVVTVKDVNGLSVTALGDWQQKIQDQWVNEATRVCYCDVASFGRRYQPMPIEFTGRAACTGIAATWCPIHGDCTCPYRNDDEDQGRTLDGHGCPLHDDDSHHADPKYHPVEA